MLETIDRPTENAAAETVWIALDLIDIPHDARTHDPQKLESLAQDLKVNGQLQEIVVTPTPRNADTSIRYEVLAGVGRVLAARKLGWEKIRCLVKEGLSDFDKARITYAENEEREDADPFYQAAQLKKMKEAKGWSQEELAKELGQAESNVKIYLALLSTSSEFQDGARRLALDVSHLREILRLPDAQDRIKLTQECHDNDLSVRALKAMVDQKLGKAERNEGEKGNGEGGEGKGAKKLPDPLQPLWQKLESERFKLGTWSVGYPKEDQWVFHLKPSREDPVPALINLLDGLSMKLSDYQRKLEDEKDAAANERRSKIETRS